MRIGIPKETRPGEARVASTPEIVKRLVGKGFDLVVESGAGAGAGYPDGDYAGAGGRITDRAGAYDADLVLRVRRPDEDDVAALRPGGLLIGLLESCGEDPLVGSLLAKGVRILPMERMPRTSRAQSMDVLSSQANIAGYRAVIEAAARYGRFFPMMMTS
ncbi:MAG: NAD(P)(+) transhydrogenase (Re/Si-specific) subunit alpha, partial [Chromatiaceae bacterium]